MILMCGIPQVHSYYSDRIVKLLVGLQLNDGTELTRVLATCVLVLWR
jgi:hypothetical protein